MPEATAWASCAVLTNERGDQMTHHEKVIALLQSQLESAKTEIERLRSGIEDTLDQWHFSECDDDHQAGAVDVCESLVLNTEVTK